MGFMISEALADVLAVAIGTELTDGTIQIYGSPISQAEANSLIPASASAAIGTATLLCEVTNGLAGLGFEASASGGVIAKSTSETWLGAVIASGYASFYRFVLSTDTGALSSTEIRSQGTVGTVGTDLVIADSFMTLGAEQRIDSFVIGQPMG